MRPNLQAMSVPALRALASGYGIVGRSSMRKADLISALTPMFPVPTLGNKYRKIARLRRRADRMV